MLSVTVQKKKKSVNTVGNITPQKIISHFPSNFSHSMNIILFILFPPLATTVNTRSNDSNLRLALGLHVSSAPQHLFI